MTRAILYRQRSKRVNARHLRVIVEELLVNLGIASAELGINLVGAREMTLLNETFLRHGGSTDVITFNHGTDAETSKSSAPCLHGGAVCVRG